MPSERKRVFFRKHVFLVDENVYEPAEDSFLFAENIEVKEGERVLDMGTGCGLLAILAAEKADEVVAVDVNPYAVRCAKKNAKLSGASGKIAFVRGNLFDALHEKTRFDLILFNAPYLPKDESELDSWLTRSWSGGTFGRETIDRFIAQSAAHLERNGRILLLQSNIAGIAETFHAFEANCFRAEIIAECSVPFFETLVLFKAEFRVKKAPYL
jgi:release factor glutamine methyltransferase